MKIFSANKVREADEFTIENEPISSINLMERASVECTRIICELYNNINHFAIFAGPGNNGGDGLAIARLLFEKNYKLTVYIVKFTDKFSEDFNINFQRLKENTKIRIEILDEISKFPKLQENTIIIDAIFGSGLTRKLSGFPKEVVEKINSIKANVIAVDIPSGLFGEENNCQNSTKIKATHTITFESPFLSFFYPENDKYVGKFYIALIGIHEDYINNTDTEFYFVEKKDVVNKIIKRKKYSHKGTYGHTLILAGSYGKAGACVLAAKAAHRVGAGLVTVVVPKCNYNVLQISSPETMLQVDSEKKNLNKLPELKGYNSVAIGPGIGFNKKTKSLLFELIEKSEVPIVFDADAITILSEHKDYLKKIPPNSVFTPHPKEFERLCGVSKNDYRRTLKQIDFAKKYKCYVVLKGAHTTTATPEGKCYFNSTGNPGMATAGAGDVLTGMIVGLSGQDYSPKDAVITAVYLHGLAGDIYTEKYSQESLIASDIIKSIPKAFKEIKNIF